jgi:hypothetical protein
MKFSILLGWAEYKIGFNFVRIIIPIIFQYMSGNSLLCHFNAENINNHGLGERRRKQVFVCPLR